MFSGCFSYDRKGPCHIYQPETPPQKKAAEEELPKLDEELEPILREEWKLKTGKGKSWATV